MQTDWQLPILFAGSFVLVLFAIAIIVFVIINKHKQNRFYFEQQRVNAQHENELLKTALDVQERSMKALSIEIHDNVNQTLGVAKLRLNKMIRNATSEQEVTDHKAIKAVIDHAISDLRNMSHSLNNEHLKKQGLATSVKKLLDQIEDSQEIKTFLNIIENHHFFDEMQEVLLYRIIQKAVKNTLTHAAAKIIAITVCSTEDKFIFTIEDDGIGFNTTTLDNRSNGFRNIAERTRLLGATLEINSVQYEGTRIKLFLKKSKHANA